MKNDKSPMLIDNAQFGWIQSACIMSRKGTNVFSPDKMNQDSYFHITDSANDTFVMCVLDGTLLSFPLLISLCLTLLT